MPIKIQYRQTKLPFFLRFTKALVALSCSGGVFFLQETKVSNFLKLYFITSVAAPALPFLGIDLYRYFEPSIFVYDLTPV